MIIQSAKTDEIDIKSREERLSHEKTQQSLEINDVNLVPK